MSLTINALLICSLFAQSARPGDEGQGLPPLPSASSPASGSGPAPTTGEKAGATLHQDFEAGRTTWRQEDTDTTVDLRTHDRSNRAAHDGTGSEHFEFDAGAGSYVYYSHPLPKIPLTPDLRAVLYVKANRSGVQLFARVVLPDDIDPETRQPSFVMLAGPVYDQTGRWQRLELADFSAAVERQARILRAASDGQRKVSLKDAYIERLVVNLYGGPGQSDVFLDDLTISPVPESAVMIAEDSSGASKPAGNAVAKAGAQSVRLERYRLSKDGFDWMPTIIRAPGANTSVLRRYGFDVLSVDMNTTAETIQAAVRDGFLLMPHLNTPVSSAPRTASEILEAMEAYPYRDQVAFWYLADSLGGDPDPEVRRGELETIRGVVGEMHAGRRKIPGLTTASVIGQFPSFARAGRSPDLIGVHPAPWGTCMEPMATYHYLAQRRNLTALVNPEALFWSWVQARPPVAFRRAIWGDDSVPAWGVPRVQPEQLRVWTYAALAAGYRGIGFLGDANLTRGLGSTLLSEMALLRAEIDLVESIIARAPGAIPLLNAFPPDVEVPIIFNTLGNSGGLSSANRQSTQMQPPETQPSETIKAASIGTLDNRGRLLLITEFAAGAQWQPPQMALNNLKVYVKAPETAHVIEFSPGGYKFLDHERTAGGIRITVPEFNVTSLVLVTTDLELVGRIKKEINRIAPMATSLLITQVQEILNETIEIDRRLQDDGHVPERVTGVLDQAKEYLAAAREFHERGEYAACWGKAQMVGRATRLLRRAHWELALKEFADASKTSRQKDEDQAEKIRRRRNAQHRELKLKKPKGPFYPKLIELAIGSAPLCGFNTLPQHYIWMSNVKDGKFGPNLFEGGTFDAGAEGSLPDGWEDVSYRQDGFDAKATVEKLEPKFTWDEKPGKVLQLRVFTDREHSTEEVPAFLDHPLAAVRTPPIPIGARQLVRIRVMLRMLIAAPPGAGGLIVRDSIGGEALQYRDTTANGEEWRELVLYRRAPEDTDLTLTIGLASFGIAYIDDIRVDRLEQIGPGSLGPDVARRMPDTPGARAAGGGRATR
jgi:hypothetical protein